MQFTCETIRENARRSLKGKWTLIALCTLLYSNLRDVMDLMPSKLHLGRVSLTLTLVSTALFIFGYNDIILQMTRGNNVEFLKFFSGCKRALRGFRMYISVGVITLLYSILLVIPGVIAMIKYSMTFFIWVDNPNISVSEAIDKSVDMTSGHKLEIFKLILSFIGWFLLIFALFLGVEYMSRNYITNSIWLAQNCGKIILSIGFIYLETYINVSMGVLYNKLMEVNASEENKLVLDEQTRQLN
ncbi:DUF975 family protein [Clostridium sp.]|uniref:DUF975 family protein n=1 Tax=Clostridium sp. TaxID=1506 RepID=UPI00284DDCCE|nr:DUF975 family protein [Clostridium sp.]MDR3594033.1 DUF975 family protein [Clostridium sp.]